MSKNTKDLQQQAAGRLFLGQSMTKISQALGVRLSTVMRWRSSPVFMEHLALLKSNHKQDMELYMLRVAQKAMMDIEIGMDYAPDIKQSCGVLNTLKNIDKMNIFADETPQNQRKSAKKHPKSAETHAESAGISDNPAEIIAPLPCHPAECASISAGSQGVHAEVEAIPT